MAVWSNLAAWRALAMSDRQLRQLKVWRRSPADGVESICHFWVPLVCFRSHPSHQVAHVATRHSCKWGTCKTLQLEMADGQKLWGFLAACKTRPQVTCVLCFLTDINKHIATVQLVMVLIFLHINLDRFSSSRRYRALWSPTVLWWLFYPGPDGPKPWHCFSSCRSMRFRDQSLPSTQWCRLCGRTSGKGLATY